MIAATPATVNFPVLAEPTWQGRLTTTDLRALTPLKWLHVNPYGTFTLHMHERLPLAHAV